MCGFRLARGWIVQSLLELLEEVNEVGLFLWLVDAAIRQMVDRDVVGYVLNLLTRREVVGLIVLDLSGAQIVPAAGIDASAGDHVIRLVEWTGFRPSQGVDFDDDPEGSIGLDPARDDLALFAVVRAVGIGEAVRVEVAVFVDDNFEIAGLRRIGMIFVVKGDVSRARERADDFNAVAGAAGENDESDAHYQRSN